MRGMLPFGAEQYVLERKSLKRLAIRFLGELHFGVRVRSWYLAAALRNVNDPEAILEVGCSRGQMSFWLRRRFPNTFIKAIDIDPSLIEHCNHVAREFDYTNLEFVAADVNEYQDSRYYDLVVCFDVLEHIQAWEKALGRMITLLRPGGRLLIHTPRRGHFQSSRFGFRGWFGPSTSRVIYSEHVREGFSPEDFVLLRAYGVDYVQTYTFGPFSMWLHTFFERYRGGLWLWRVFFTPLLLVLALVDEGHNRGDGGALLVVGVKGD